MKTPEVSMGSMDSDGLDPDRIERIERLLQDAHEKKQFAGAAWAIVRRRGVAASGCLGTLAHSGSAAVDQRTLFDLASVTKTVSTAAPALYLFDRGDLLLGDEISRYLPEAGGKWDGVTIRHLFTHTSGLPPYANLYGKVSGVDEVRKGILALEPHAKPGEKYAYSCLGYIMLQNIIQTITGESLAAFAARAVFEPLGMKETLYNPPADLRSRIAPGGFCPHRDRMVVGEVHDPLACAAGGVSGNAGIFSTLEDVCRFARMLLSGGGLDGYRMFNALTAGMMLTNQIDPAIGGHTLGLFASPNGMLPRGETLPASTVGHTGFTGTSLTLCPALDLGAVLLTNCLYYTNDKSEFFRTRRLFHTLVGAAVLTDPMA